ncbi:ABC transporter substrate-binding protein [Peptacetobacter hiranonis]|uniref:ABC transporter substrate-binding protein n=1 Tax=Peptacetobacter hiranonis TaxID=89152 RepID=UPI002E7641CC|nr:ABC transporter substrate-binding protein [Peptacetobacter hiranonis]MEE0248847.1 ABC transporter substrate-binding protein [Peptacetobacter hiranonis]
MKKTKIISMILAVALAVGGCSAFNGDKKEEKASDTKKTYSEKIQLAIQKPSTISPITNTDESVLNVLNLVYDGLFELNKNYNAIPKLVKNSKMSSDGKQMDIVLKDAKWHDGNPVTADDVAFTVSSIRSNKTSPYNYMVQNISDVVVNGEKNLTIKFKNNAAFAKENLTFPIISKVQLSGKDINNVDANKVGNGVYKIASYSDREGISLEVNKDYYGDIPKSAMNINVNIVPNEDAVVSTVEALESDMVKADSDNLSRFQNSRFDIKSYEGRDYDAVIINQSNPLLANANFRKAIVSAINRAAIIENGYMGHVHSVNIPINSKSKYYESSIKNMEYSTENAEKYMKEIKINKKDKIKETQVNATNKPNNKVNSSSGNNKTNSSNKPSSSGNSGGASNNTGTLDSSGSDANQAPSGGDSGAQNGGNSNAGSSSGGESAGNGATRIIDSSEATRNIVYSTDEDKEEFEKIADENSDSVIATNLVRTANNTKENANNQNNNAANNNQNSNNQNKNTTQNKNDADNKKPKKEENPYYTEKEIKTMINSITLKIIVNRENSERVKSANMISENLKAVGIKSEVVLLDSLGMQKSLANRSYDLAVTGWQISSIPNITEIMKAICPNDVGLNERLGKIQGATSEEDIKKIYADIEKYCIDNALFISIGVKDNYMIINKRLKTDLYMNDYDQYRGIEMVTPSK